MDIYAMPKKDYRRMAVLDVYKGVNLESRPWDGLI